MQPEESIAPLEAIGIDLGLREIAATSDGDRLAAGRWTRRFAQKLASAQRRGHKRQAKRIYRQAARCRADALHKFSRRMVDQYLGSIGRCNTFYNCEGGEGYAQVSEVFSA
jgi:transposase